MPLISIPIPVPDALYAVLSGAGSHLLLVFAAFASATAPVAVMALWQGATVAFVLALCLRLVPRVSASHRFAIWGAAFAVVAALPFLPLFAHSAVASVAQPTSLRSVTIKPWLQLDSRWAFIVAALWLLASAFRAADLAVHSLRLRRLFKSATPVEVDPTLHSLLAAASRSRRLIQICTTCELDRPGVIGFLAPRILIPDWLFEKLTQGELEHVLLHEAEHLRRRDDWTNLLQKLSLILFPLNPALIWMERRLCREREMACDEGVVRRTQAPRAYAACLTSLAERALDHGAQALSLGAFGRRPELVHRVHSILWRKHALHPFAARAWMAVVGCGLLFATVELVRCPQVVAFVPHQASNLANAQPATASPSALRAANALPAQAISAASNVRMPANGIRMIETKAILPDHHRNAAPLVAASPRPNQQPGPPQSHSTPQSERASLGTAPGAPRQALLSAKSPASAAAPAPPQDQHPQFIILTTWEQVQTSPHHGRQFADYDPAPDPTPQNPDVPSQNPVAPTDSQAATGSPAQPAMQITVTQLILTVYPAGSVPPAPKHSHAKKFIYAPPTALPFDGGWLVFTL